MNVQMPQLPVFEQIIRQSPIAFAGICQRESTLTAALRPTILRLAALLMPVQTLGNRKM